MNIVFGAMADPIRDQLINQKIVVRKGVGRKFKHLQKHSMELINLRIAGFLTDKEVHAARKRIMKYISSSLVERIP